ncbi:MAG: energy transducer TonB [Hyphomicrobium sp.]|nr:energy transducer TonB [Hyphomicrobium sp.]
MSADKIVLTADSTHGRAEHLAATKISRQPIFLIGLIGAVAVHAALILGLIGSPSRYIGDPEGSSRVINVELINEAEFQNSAPSTSRPDNPPSAATVAPPPQPEEPRAQPEEPSASEPDLPQKSAKQPPLETEKPKTPSPQDTPEKRKVTEIDPNYELKPPAPLDLRVPFYATTTGAQRSSSGATRPPGITRSGENDKFGRDVIRSLRKMMPPPRGIKGRVTIRIFLDGQGNIAKAELVQSGGNRELDQSVLFSAQQVTFPYPPKGATVADRTFRVTYIYR